MAAAAARSIFEDDSLHVISEERLNQMINQKVEGAVNPIRNQVVLLQGQMVEKDEQIRQFTTTIGSLEDKVRDVTTKNHALETRNAEQNAEISSLNERVKALQDEGTMRDQENANLRKEAEEITAILNSNPTLKTDFQRAQLAFEDAKVARLRTEYNAHTAQLRRLQAIMDDPELQELELDGF